MKIRKHVLTAFAIVAAVMLCLTGCSNSVDDSNKSSKSVNTDKLEGTWETVNVGIDGSIFTFDELDSLGETYVEETTIVFKDGGKAIVFVKDDDFSTMYNWESTGENEWIMSDDWEEFEFVKEEDGLVMKYDDYGTDISLYFEKLSDEQIVPNISEEENEEEKDNEAAEETVTTTKQPIDIYKAMDEYETFFDEYIEFMEEYESSDDPMDCIDEYEDYMDQYVETMDAIYSVDVESLTSEEKEYYTEVTNRITEKLIENSL